MESQCPADLDPLGEAERRLFPPIRNRTLAQAAEVLAAGHVQIAEPLVSKYLRRSPTEPDALNLMADIVRRQGRHQQAEELLERCVERAPNGIGFRYNYALSLKALSKLTKSLDQFDELLKRDPGNPLFREQKAKVLSSMGRSDEAIGLRRKLVDDYPHVAGFWLMYGDVLRGPGHQEECLAAYLRALEIDPSMTEIYLHLSDMKTYRFGPHEIRNMEAQLALPGRSSEDRTNLHFALGKAHGDNKNYAKSFDNYLRGNALRRLTLGIASSDQMATHRQNCEAIFTDAFFRERADWGCKSRAPIFIVGMPRSGSTLLEQILSSHSAIEGLGELKDLENVIAKRLDAHELCKPPPVEEGLYDPQSAFIRAYPLLFKNVSADVSSTMGEEYVATATSRRALDTPFFIDKALSNFGQVGLLQIMLPNAKIIDARRHPIASSWSCFTNFFPNGMRFSYRLEDIADHYANYVRLMAHFDRVLPGKVHRVFYEELVANPEEEVRRLLKYLDLPFEEQCLRFHENKRMITTLSSEQVRQPLYKGASEQWIPYDPWLGPLKARLGRVATEYPRVPDPESG